MEVQMHDTEISDEGEFLTTPVTINGVEVREYSWNANDEQAIEFIKSRPNGLWVVLRKG